MANDTEKKKEIHMIIGMTSTMKDASGGSKLPSGQSTFRFMKRELTNLHCVIMEITILI